MGVLATLSTTTLAVDVGQVASCTVEIRNTGRVVDQFTIGVAGGPGDWAAVEPASVNLLPDESATVAVTFAPPARTLAGAHPFAVHVRSHVDPQGSTVEEGSIEVGGYDEVTAEVVPATLEASGRAGYRLAVDNRGNHPVAVWLGAVDPENRVGFRVRPAALELDAHQTAFVRVKAKPYDRFLRGTPIRHRFQVTAKDADGTTVATAEATLVQRQLFPKWLLPALGALVVLALLLGTLWFALLRPAVQSAAGDAAAKEAAAVRQVAQEAKQDAGSAKQEAGTAKQDSGQAKQNSERAMREVGVDPARPESVAPTSGQVSRPARGQGDAIDFRVAADAAIDANAKRFKRFTFAAPDNKVLVITDAILQNPRADLGTMQIMRVNDQGESVILENGLANFRDLDHHWVQPLVFQPGDKVVIAVSCQNPPERGACSPSVSFSGRLGG